MTRRSGMENGGGGGKKKKRKKKSFWRKENFAAGLRFYLVKFYLRRNVTTPLSRTPLDEWWERVRRRKVEILSLSGAFCPLFTTFPCLSIPPTFSHSPIPLSIPSVCHLFLLLPSSIVFWLFSNEQRSVIIVLSNLFAHSSRSFYSSDSIVSRLLSSTCDFRLIIFSWNFLHKFFILK